MLCVWSFQGTICKKAFFQSQKQVVMQSFSSQCIKFLTYINSCITANNALLFQSPHECAFKSVSSFNTISVLTIMVSTECATEVSKMERIITVEYTDCAIRGKNPCLSRRIVDSKLHHLSKFNIKWWSNMKSNKYVIWCFYDSDFLSLLAPVNCMQMDS